jgi:hypothetical protein
MMPVDYLVLDNDKRITHRRPCAGTHWDSSPAGGQQTGQDSR